MPPARSSRGPRAKKPQLTHFLSIPLVNDSSRAQLETSLATFREDVADVLPEKAIRPLGSLHCTLGVMELAEIEDLDKAITFLQNLDVHDLLQMFLRPKEVVKGNAKPLRVQLKGLETLHSPSDTGILYVAPQDSTNRLMSFCIAIKQAFEDEELLVPQWRPLLLHTTIVNTIYAKEKGAKQKSAQSASGDAPALNEYEQPLPAWPRGHVSARAPLGIDALDLLNKYENFTWAQDVLVDRIAICEMGAKKIYNEEGHLISEEYKEVAHIALPT